MTIKINTKIKLYKLRLKQVKTGTNNNNINNKLKSVNSHKDIIVKMRVNQLN